MTGQPTGSPADSPGGRGREPHLEASLHGLSRRPGLIELTVRLHNPSPDRALHYVSELRAIVFDDITGRFLLRLTDSGREPLTGSMMLRPTFGRVDPAGTALLALRVPAEITRMRVPSSPTREVELDRFELGPEADLEVVIGWSDTPFYPDPRQDRTTHSSVVEWERGQARFVIPAGIG